MAKLNGVTAQQYLDWENFTCTSNMPCEKCKFYVVCESCSQIRNFLTELRGIEENG